MTEHGAALDGRPLPVGAHRALPARRPLAPAASWTPTLHRGGPGRVEKPPTYIRHPLERSGFPQTGPRVRPRVAKCGDYPIISPL
jgi:hypothetical protein